jgi:uncharacterized protein
VSNEASTTVSSAAWGDPAPLGLSGFALTTLVLSVSNAGLVKEAGAGVLVLGLAAFYGGLAQFVAGVVEFRRGNTFGATAFGSFGAFWLSEWWIDTHVTAATGDIHQATGLLLLGWAIFTGFMTVGALRTNLATLAVFAALTLTFLFLALGAFQNGTQPDSLTKIGGYLGILTGLLAWYTAAAVVINSTHKRELLPTWPR